MQIVVKIKIGIQYRFKLLNQIIIDRFIGNKLAFVKSAAVIENEFNLWNNNILTEVVYPTVEFLVNNFENRE